MLASSSRSSHCFHRLPLYHSAPTRSRFVCLLSLVQGPLPRACLYKNFPRSHLRSCDPTSPATTCESNCTIKRQRPRCRPPATHTLLIQGKFLSPLAYSHVGLQAQSACSANLQVRTLSFERVARRPRAPSCFQPGFFRRSTDVCRASLHCCRLWSAKS